MEQFVLVPIFVYNSKNKKPTVVTKRNHPIIRSKKNPRTRLNLWTKIPIRTFLLKLILWLIKFYVHLAENFRPRTFLSWMEGTLEFLWQTLLRHWNEKTLRFLIFFFNLLDAADITPSLVLNKNAKKRERELSFFQGLRNKNCSYSAKVLQLMFQSETWQRHANPQFQKCKVFLI